jgi:Zn-dependent membrane protease YugP
MSTYHLYWIIFGGIAVASWLVSSNLQHKFKKYSQTPLRLSGREVAEKMLRDHGIFNVQVAGARGHLTDHFNPKMKTVYLSESVYNQCNVAAAAVAAHECGHVIQHATAYAPLKVHSALVPAVQFSSNIMPMVLLGGMILLNVFPQLMLFGIILFSITTLFSFILLPIEIDASKRAIAWLGHAGITNGQTDGMARRALRSAAYTYIMAALSSLATLFYYVMLFMRRSR